ncbi:MAG: hypothetical protein NWF01_07710 [Candidatus Bathyarchaeota archaeon]|nr:hypothetical protein [Candidatus Bathyarchaeota archaeon]
MPDDLSGKAKSPPEEKNSIDPTFQEKILDQVCNSMTQSNLRFKGIISRINITFWSILAMNWILIGVAVVMFIGAVYAALGGRLDVTLLLSVTGFADIFTVFRFSMNRVQTNLGDQVQVEVAYDSYVKQISQFDQHFNINHKTEDLKTINNEIRQVTLNTMMLIQKYTKIGTESSHKEWLTLFPIRYGQLEIPKEVSLGQKVTMKGTLRNVGDKPVTLESIVIALRPPGGTPEGGPLGFDFFAFPGQVIKPNQEIEIKKEQTIDSNWTNRPDPTYLDKAWYAFIACKTEDGVWHNDCNKYSFIVHDKKAEVTKNPLSE